MSCFLKKTIKSLPSQIDDLLEFNRRCNYAFSCTRQCVDNASPINEQQKQEILEFWKPYKADWKSRYAFDLKRFDLYNQTNKVLSQPLPYYIPDSFYYAIIDSGLTHPVDSGRMDDKNLYDLYFHGVKMPDTIARIVNGFYLDKQYHRISRADLISQCKEAGNVICKPAMFSSGGMGIEFWNSDDDPLKLDKILQQSNVVIQALQPQHDVLNQIYAGSLNTVRVLTIMLEDESRVLSSVLRTGANGNKVDNVSSGGFACGIHPETGKLRSIAYNNKGESINKHPQGSIYADYTIPGFDKIKQTAVELSYRMCRISRLISWDFAISPDGDPVLIECNLTFGEIDFHEMCNGPVFGAETPAILEWFFKKHLPSVDRNR